MTFVESKVQDSKNTTRHSNYDLNLRKAVDIAKHDPALEQKVEHFSKMTLVEQYDTLHRTRKYGFASESDELSQCFASLQLLPDNMQTFALTKGDLQKNVIQRHNTLVTRNSAAIRVLNPKHILEQQIEILSKTKKYGAKAILALLLVSGRRETEILNGKSVFQSVPDFPYYAMFTGALKKKVDYLQNDNTSSFQIPLLCKFTLFEEALGHLRNTQKPDVIDMTNKQISKRYCSQLCTATKHQFPMLTKPHDLRAVYVRFVDILFEHNIAFPLLCMNSLGHETMTDTLHYMSVLFDGAIPDTSHGSLL